MINPKGPKGSPSSRVNYRKRMKIATEDTYKKRGECTAVHGKGKGKQPFGSAKALAAASKRKRKYRRK